MMEMVLQIHRVIGCITLSVLHFNLNYLTYLLNIIMLIPLESTTCD